MDGEIEGWMKNEWLFGWVDACMHGEWMVNGRIINGGKKIHRRSWCLLRAESKKGVNWSEESWKHPSLHARFFDLTATQLRSELDPARLLQTTPSSAAAVQTESSLPQRLLGRGAGSAREYQRSATAVPTLLGPSGDGLS